MVGLKSKSPGTVINIGRVLHDCLLQAALLCFNIVLFVAVLVNEKLSAGSYTYNYDASSLSIGVYF